MANIFHQSIEDILKTATSEQKILWNEIFLRYGDRIAISQAVFNAALPNELTTYVAGKMFFAYQLTFTYNQVGIIGGAGQMLLYDELNSIKGSYANTFIYWDVTAAAVRGLMYPIDLKNVLFSRVSAGLYSYVNLIGYRITY